MAARAAKEGLAKARAALNNTTKAANTSIEQLEPGEVQHKVTVQGTKYVVEDDELEPGEDGGLSAIGLKGGSGKKIARKMYGKLPPHAKKQLIRTVKSIKMNNFTNKIYDVVDLIYENLTWNALKDSFSELGWWDATTFALSFAAIFASGGVAFLINVGLLTYDAGMLVVAINDCFF